jgi:hypothetical protein
MFLGVGKHADDNQGRYDKSFCDVLHHGCHSTEISRAATMMITMGAAVNARRRKTKDPRRVP